MKRNDREKRMEGNKNNFNQRRENNMIGSGIKTNKIKGKQQNSKRIGRQEIKII